MLGVEAILAQFPTALLTLSIHCTRSFVFIINQKVDSLQEFFYHLLRIQII